ncbi:hypothetical protein ACWEN6_25125 [Sphaerisporangium sp. NPDC004334]
MPAIPVATRARRCRYLQRDSNPCPNEALSDDDKAIAICGHHAAQVIHLVAEAKAAHLGQRRT